MIWGKESSSSSDTTDVVAGRGEDQLEDERNEVSPGLLAILGASSMASVKPRANHCHPFSFASQNCIEL